MAKAAREVEPERLLPLRQVLQQRNAEPVDNVLVDGGDSR
jgi:hypothetical protein